MCGVPIQEGVYCSNCQSNLLEMTKKISEKKAQEELKSRLDILREEAKKNNIILVVEENIQEAESIAKRFEENIPDHTVIALNEFEKITGAIHTKKVRFMLISDAVGENFDGLKILRKIRDDYSAGDVPIIVTTNMADDEKKEISKHLGARYYVEKPLRYEFIEQIKKFLVEELRLRNMLVKFLLIDDNEDDLEIEKEILEENFNCTVFTADSGMEGAEFLKNIDKIDLIFISFQMFFMDGLRALKLVRQNKIAAKVPIIFLNNKEDIDTVRRIKSSSAVGYINKPEFSSDSLDFIEEILVKGR